ncbi:MAG: hypothetical protein KIS68_00085 [Bauldia sp.]|nr:hypothetical protein [Bauldia sp.]
MSQRLIRIHPLGGIGNQTFQLMFAEAIRLALGDVAVTGHDLAEWNLRGDPATRRRAVAIECRAHAIPLTAIVDFMRAVPDVEVSIRSVALRYAYYRGHRAHFSRLFRSRGEARPVGPGELAINIRLGDILVSKHSEYFPLPLVWYEQLVDKTGLSPVFIGQVGDDPYSTALRRRFRGARFVEPTSPEVDFATLRGARHVAISISTFAWLAAWLSEAAETIHLPVAGLFHPGARPDIDLLPLGDDRYRFHQSDLHHWKGTAAEIETLIAGDDRLLPASHAELAMRFAPHIGTEGVGLADVPVSLGPGGLRALPQTASPRLSRRVLATIRRRLASPPGAA